MAATLKIGLKTFTVISAPELDADQRAAWETSMYESELAEAQRAYQDGNTAGLTNAIAIVQGRQGATWPGWITDGLAAEWLKRESTAGPVKHGRHASARTRRRAYLIDQVRAWMVDQLLEKGHPKRGVYHEASRCLQGDAACNPKVMKQSHVRFHKRMEVDPSAFYI